MVNSHEGRKPSTSWTRPPGRPHRTWLNLVQEDANAIPLSSLWRTEISRGHGAAQRWVRCRISNNEIHTFSVAAYWYVSTAVNVVSTLVGTTCRKYWYIWLSGHRPHTHTHIFLVRTQSHSFSHTIISNHEKHSCINKVHRITTWPVTTVE